jgi:hypothetical protein
METRERVKRPDFLQKGANSPPLLAVPSGFWVDATEPLGMSAFGSRSMLPENELASFLLTVEDAVDLARDGDAADGYEMLLAGKDDR